MVNFGEHPAVARVLATGYPMTRQQHRSYDEDAVFEERREGLLFPDPQGSPCEGCWRQSICDNGCDRWEREYLRRQKKINAFARAVYRGRQKPGRDVFAYSHPDLVRRYEKTHPCGDCLLKKGCAVPCGRYLHWYDLRLELARKRVRS